MIKDIQEIYTEIEEERKASNGTLSTSADSEETMRLICEACDSYKAKDITVLDVQGQTIIADYFVVCSGTSTTHIQSIAEGVREKLREEASARAKPEGEAGSFWVVLDFSDVILHVFDEETREFYDLESLWADAKISRYEEGVLIAAPQVDEASEQVDETNEVNGAGLTQ